MKCETVQLHEDQVIRLEPGMRLEDAVADYLNLPAQVVGLEKRTKMEYAVSMAQPFVGPTLENIGTLVHLGKNMYAFQHGENYDLIQ